MSYITNCGITPQLVYILESYQFHKSLSHTFFLNFFWKLRFWELVPWIEFDYPHFNNDTEFKWLVHGQLNAKWWIQVDCPASHSPELHGSNLTCFYHQYLETPGCVTALCPQTESMIVPHSDTVCSLFEIFLQSAKKMMF